MQTAGKAQRHCIFERQAGPFADAPPYRTVPLHQGEHRADNAGGDRRAMMGAVLRLKFDPGRDAPVFHRVIGIAVHVLALSRAHP